MKWAGYMGCVGQVRNAYKFLVGKSERRDTLGSLGTDERIILKWVIMKQDTRLWTGLVSGKGPMNIEMNFQLQ